MALFLKNFEGAIPNEVARVGRMYGFDCQLMVESRSLSILVRVTRLDNHQWAFDLHINRSDDLIEVLKDFLSSTASKLPRRPDDGITHS